MRPVRTNKQHLKAFTLIEALVALAIFAMAATVLMSAFVNALTARERSVQNDLLADDIEAVRLQLLMEPSREDAEAGGDFPTLHHGEAVWRAAIEPTNLIDLFQVNFHMEFSDPPENSPAFYEETLFLLRPTWSEADRRSELLDDKRKELLDSRRFSRF